MFLDFASMANKAIRDMRTRTFILKVLLLHASLGYFILSRTLANIWQNQFNVIYSTAYVNIENFSA